jgi:hypothetical protein
MSCPECDAETEDARESLTLCFDSKDYNTKIEASYCPKCGYFEVNGWSYDSEIRR